VIARTSMREAVSLGLEELSRTLELLRSLDADDWARPTDCTGWSVHDVVAHLVGQFEGAARPDRLLRRVRAARRMKARLNNEGRATTIADNEGERPPSPQPSTDVGYAARGKHSHARPSAARQAMTSVLDWHNELQVRERADVPPAELMEQLESWGERGIRAFGRIPAPLRRMRLSRLFPEAVELPDDSLDFLIRIIGPRDPWMHRIDICSAVGRPFVADGHDAKIVEQVVGDLIQLWANPAVRLVLEGPAGAAGGGSAGEVSNGEWVVGQGVPVAEVRCDAIAYCRHASGRPAPGARVTGARQVGEALLAVKISF